MGYDRPGIITSERHSRQTVPDMRAYRKTRERRSPVPHIRQGMEIYGTCPLYGKYTTKEWTKYLIERRQDIEPAGAFIYRNESFTVYSKEELDRMVGILHGRLFDGFRQGLFILWGYRMEWKELPAWEWNMLKAETHLSFLGVSPVRIRTDHDGHTVTIYKKSE